MVDDINPPGVIDIGSKVTIPVYVRAYPRRNGAAYSLSVGRTQQARGEAF